MGFTSMIQKKRKFQAHRGHWRGEPLREEKNRTGRFAVREVKKAHRIGGEKNGLKSEHVQRRITLAGKGKTPGSCRASDARERRRKLSRKRCKKPHLSKKKETVFPGMEAALPEKGKRRGGTEIQFKQGKGS